MLPHSHPRCGRTGSLKKTGPRIPSLRVGGMRVSLTAIALLLVIAACGPVGGSGSSAPTASSVALKLSDLPSGMHRCDLSGDINAYLKKIQTSDPTTYSSTKTHWEAAQKGGATAADVESTWSDPRSGSSSDRR